MYLPILHSDETLEEVFPRNSTSAVHNAEILREFYRHLCTILLDFKSAVAEPVCFSGV